MSNVSHLHGRVSLLFEMLRGNKNEDGRYRPEEIENKLYIGS